MRILNHTTMPLQKRLRHPKNNIRYRLLRIGNDQDIEFQICVQYQNERLTLPLPTKEKSKAQEMYHLIAKAKVTPCTLLDVIEDLGT